MRSIQEITVMRLNAIHPYRRLDRRALSTPLSTGFNSDYMGSPQHMRVEDIREGSIWSLKEFYFGSISGYLGQGMKL